jgi:hypothetical protein
MLVAVGLPLGSFAANITTLYNTGVSSTGALLGVGSIDPHYTDTAAGHSVFVLSKNGAWVSPGVAANYIAPDASTGASFGGFYTLDYVTSFDLTGFDPSTVSITGLWSTDNFGNNIFVNGNSTGNSNSGFGSLKSFTLSGASGFFNSGINTLDFQWGNSGGPGGLAIIFSSATAGVPEPATMTLFGAGIATLIIASRRKRSRQQI